MLIGTEIPNSVQNGTELSRITNAHYAPSERGTGACSRGETNMGAGTIVSTIR